MVKRTYPSMFWFLVCLAALLAGVDVRARDILVRSGVPVGIAADGQAGTVTTAGSLHNGRVAVDNAPDGAWADINVTATGFSDTGHRWIPPATVEPSYDDDGNLLADGRWTYTWDVMNRLVAMAPTPNALAAGVPNQTITFAYDFASRRIGKKVTTTSGTGTTVNDTRYLYDGRSRGARRDPRQTADRRPGGRERNGVPLPSTCVAEFEYDELDGLIPKATYVWSLDLSGTLQGAGGVGGLLSVSLLSSVSASSVSASAVSASAVSASAVSASSVFLPCYDANGNIIAWTDGNGSPAQRQDYALFGNLVIVERLAITPADSARLTYGFSTKPLDAETGLHYYGYRFYDGRNGRWINQDPIEENEGINLYGFVGNNGVSCVDLWGLAEPLMSQIINGTVGLGASPSATFVNDDPPAPITESPEGQVQLLSSLQIMQAFKKWERLAGCPCNVDSAKPAPAKDFVVRIRRDRKMNFNINGESVPHMRVEMTAPDIIGGFKVESVFMTCIRTDKNVSEIPWSKNRDSTSFWAGDWSSNDYGLQYYAYYYSCEWSPSKAERVWHLKRIMYSSKISARYIFGTWSVVGSKVGVPQIIKP